MSDVPSILACARALGVKLEVRGEQIVIRPARLCHARLVADIREHKAAMLDELGVEAARLPLDQKPWLRIAQRVLEGEFDKGTRSLLKSLVIGLRGIAHPRCHEATDRLRRVLWSKWKDADE